MTAAAPAAANANATDRWLTCRVDKGLFSDERAVTYPAVGEVLVSVFVPADAVRGPQSGLGKVRVRVMRHDSTTVAILPTDYGEPVAVADTDLSDAP